MIEYAEGKLLSANCIHKLNKIFPNRLITFGKEKPIRFIETIHIIKNASS